MHFAQSGGSRKSAGELLEDCIKEYQRLESVRRAKLTTNEIKGLKVVFRMDIAFQRRLKIIWGGDKLHHTSITLELIASDFLDLSKHIGVDKQANPTWFRILSKTPAKFLAWLERSDGRFNRELDEKLNQAKSV